MRFKKAVSGILGLLLLLSSLTLASCDGRQNGSGGASSPTGQNVPSGSSSALGPAAVNDPSSEPVSTVSSAVSQAAPKEPLAFPPAIDGLLSALAASGAGNSGEVALTDEIKTQMNKMGQDYLFFTLPEVEWGRFTSDTYPDSAPGWAVNYILFTWMGVFGTFPDSVPAEQAEARIRQLFATRDDAALPARQPYNKFVNFSNGVYSLVPTSYSQDTFVYNCTSLRRSKEAGYTDYTAVCDDYRFDLTGQYSLAAGGNEEKLKARAKEWGIGSEEALNRLLETGEIASYHKNNGDTLQFRIPDGGKTPQICSFHSEYPR